jgi:ABC-type Fe2+-enterobactin transport system substrate-binding protein
MSLGLMILPTTAISYSDEPWQRKLLALGESTRCHFNGEETGVPQLGEGGENVYAAHVAQAMAKLRISS